MKCFIHGAREAVATCKQCGKAMCGDCSAYSGHTGICPACRRDEFRAEVVRNTKTRKDLIGSIVGSVISGVFLCFLLFIPTIIAIFKIIGAVKERKRLAERNEYLCAEIAKLDKALTQGGMGI